MKITSVFRGKRTLALLVLSLCEYVRGSLIFFILPIYIHGVLGLPTEIVGVATAVHYIFDTGLRTPAGWFVDRFGQWKVSAIGLPVALIGLVLLTLDNHELAAIAGVGLLGIGMAVIWPTVISKVTSGLPKSRYATAMSGVMSAWLAGAGGGAILTSWLFGDHVRDAFGLLVVLWVLALGLALAVMDSAHSRERNRRRVKLAFLIRDMRGVRVLFPGMFVQTFAMGLLMPVLVLYSKYVLGYDARTYGYLMLVGGLAAVILQIPVGHLVDRFGYRKFLAPGFVLAAVVLALLVHVHALSLLLLVVAGFGGAYALILPSWNAVLAQSVTERRRAAMFGIFMTVEGLGMAVGPVVGTTLWSSVGPLTPFYTTSVILFFMSVFYSIIRLDKLFIHREGA